jgi:hypothetical protein
VREGLVTYTRTPAWQDHATAWKGTLECGKVADVTIVDGDVLGADPHALITFQVTTTIVGGRVVFERGATPRPGDRGARRPRRRRRRLTRAAEHGRAVPAERPLLLPARRRDPRLDGPAPAAPGPVGELDDRPAAGPAGPGRRRRRGGTGRRGRRHAQRARRPRRSAGADGVMANPREYAAPGNQDPAMPWPSPLVLLGAIAQATTTLRLVAGAVIAPLRHPLLLANEIATLDLLSRGRLVVPADGQLAPGRVRGARRPVRAARPDPGRAARGPAGAVATGPVSHHGEWFRFDDVWLEPGRGGRRGRRSGSAGRACTRRCCGGWSGTGTAEPVRAALGRRPGPGPRRAAGAGRDPASLELVGGIRGTFHGADDVADLDLACKDLPAQLERGFTTICFKPSMFVDDLADVGPLCRELVRRVAALA